MTPPYLADDPPHTWLMAPPILGWWPPPPYLTDAPPHTWLMAPPIVGWWPPLPILAWCPPPPPPWLDDVLSQVGFGSVCVKAGPHETCAAGTSFHSYSSTFSLWILVLFSEFHFPFTRHKVSELRYRRKKALCNPSAINMMKVHVCTCRMIILLKHSASLTSQYPKTYSIAWLWDKVLKDVLSIAEFHSNVMSDLKLRSLIVLE